MNDDAPKLLGAWSYHENFDRCIFRTGICFNVDPIIIAPISLYGDTLSPVTLGYSNILAIG